MRKIFAVLFLVLFVFVYFTFNFYFSFIQTIQDKNYYLNDLSTDLYNYSVDKIFSSPEISEIPYLDKDLFKDLVLGVYQVSDVDNMIKSLVDEFSELEIDGSEINITIPLSIVKSKRELIVSNVSNYLFTHTNFCSSDLIFDSTTLNCIPSTMELSDLEEIINDVLGQYFFVNLLSDFNFSIILTNSFNGKVVDLLSNISALIYLVFAFFMFILLVLITVLIFKPIKLVLMWQGLTLFISSLFVIIVFYILNVFNFEIYLSNILNNDLFSYIASSLFAKMFLNILILNIPLMLFSLILVFLMKSKLKIKSEIL